MKAFRNVAYLLVSLSLALAAGLSCEKKETTTKQPEKGKEAQKTAVPADLGASVAATVNGRPINAELINKELDRYPENTRNSPSIRKSIVTRYVEDQLLAEEAERQGVDKSPDFVRDVNNMKIRLLKDQIMKDAAVVEDAEVQKYYDEHPNEWNLQERAHVFQIITADENEAKKALSRLKKGEPFEEVAKQVSTDPRAKSNGGDLNYITKDNYPDVADAIFKMKPGQLSGVVKSPRGSHVFKMVDRKPAETQMFEQVSKNLRERLIAIKKHKAVQDFVAKLKETSQIVINDGFINAGQPAEKPAEPAKPAPLQPPPPPPPPAKGK